jgi:hypothetical protein
MSTMRHLLSANAILLLVETNVYPPNSLVQPERHILILLHIKWVYLMQICTPRKLRSQSNILLTQLFASVTVGNFALLNLLLVWFYWRRMLVIYFIFYIIIKTDSATVLFSKMCFDTAVFILTQMFLSPLFPLHTTIAILLSISTSYPMEASNYVSEP